MTDIRRLFEEAAALPADQREAFVRRSCQDNSDMQKQLLAMLAAVDDEHFLGDVTAQAGVRAPAGDGPAGLREHPGQRIGSYELLETAGEGGFGTVWRAEQQAPVRRQVALKIIKLGMDTRQVIARFEAERQALAMMDHPNIAKVFDAGSTETGRPYFVMEYIEGTPIVAFCEQQNLSTRQRLDLFGQVCLAIQHAHQKGVIHRDIKPSNVLITLQDGVPVPKVIDFGIAKATNTELTQMTLYTEHRQVVGTPAYMSPEQAEMSGLDIDTRSDIYSLGVLLYELLTGTTPFTRETLQAKGFAEMMRVIREEDPPKPSTRLSSLGKTATQTSTVDHTPYAVRSQVRGDLDWIVMKCLEKDRSRRYETATGLATDIQRHLSDEPVLAGPPTTSYKLSKFVKRNRVGVLVGSVFGALLMAALGTLAVLYQWASDERDRAEILLATEQSRNQRALAAMTEMLSTSGILDSKGITPGGRARLDLATSEEVYFDVERSDNGSDRVTPRWIDADHPGDPGDQIVELLASESVYWTKRGMEQERQRAAELEQVATFQAEQLGDISPQVMGGYLRETLLQSIPEDQRAAFEDRIGDVNFTDLAVDSLKEVIFQRSIEAISEQFDEQPLVEARLLQTVARTLTRLGMWQLAIEPQDRALQIRERELGKDHPDTLYSIDRKAYLMLVKGDVDEALNLSQQALTGRTTLLGAEAPATLQTRNNFANIQHEQGQVAEAVDTLRELVPTLRRVLGAKAPQTLEALHNLGSFERSKGDYESAEAHLREALAGRREVLGRAHPKTLLTLNQLALCLQNVSKFAEAAACLEEALAGHRAALGRRHPQTLDLLNNTVLLSYSRGEHAEAERLARELLALRRSTVGNRHPDTIHAMANLGGLLTATDRMVEAEPLTREAYERRRDLLGPEHPQTLMALNNLAETLARIGRLEEGEAFLAEALEIQRKVAGEDHPNTLTYLGNMGRMVHRQNKLDEAEVYYRACLNGRLRSLGAAHFSTADMHRQLGKLLVEQGRLEAAEIELRQSLNVYRVLNGRVRFVGSDLSEVLARLGNGTQALALADEALEEAARYVTASHWTQGQFHSRRGRALLTLGRYEEAEADMLCGYETVQAGLGRSHVHTREAISHLVTLYEAWHTAAPGQGHDASGAAWAERLEAARAE